MSGCFACRSSGASVQWVSGEKRLGHKREGGKRCVVCSSQGVRMFEMYSGNIVDVPEVVENVR